MYHPDPLLPRDSPPHRAAAAALQAAGGQGRRVRHVLAGYIYIYIYIYIILLENEIYIYALCDAFACVGLRASPAHAMHIMLR